MADRISYKIDVNVAGELNVTIERSVTVEAYAKIEANVPAAEDDDNPGKATLRALPGSGEDGDGIGFLVITSTNYDKGFKLKDGSDNGDSSDSVVAVLDEPIALFSSDAISRFDIPDGRLVLVNETSRLASVQVLVGWDAIEEEEEDNE